MFKKIKSILWLPLQLAASPLPPTTLAARRSAMWADGNLEGHFVKNKITKGALIDLQNSRSFFRLKSSQMVPQV
jgi:hypothetical protein